MGIALFSAAALMESFQGMMGWLATRESASATPVTIPTASPEVWHRPARARRRPAAGSLPTVQRSQPVAGGGTGNPLACVAPSFQTQRVARAPHALQAAQHPHPAHGACTAAGLRGTRALRVVRVVDQRHPAGAGRMVISGRMADVCAELDRLAAMEAGPQALLN